LRYVHQWAALQVLALGDGPETEWAKLLGAMGMTCSTSVHWRCFQGTNASTEVTRSCRFAESVAKMFRAHGCRSCSQRGCRWTWETLSAHLARPVCFHGRWTSSP